MKIIFSSIYITISSAQGQNNLAVCIFPFVPSLYHIASCLGKKVFIQGQLNPSGLWTLPIIGPRNNAPLTLPLPLPWLTQSSNVWLSWLGAALTDSPLGLAAYIIEKFYTWTDSDTVNMPLAEATKSLPFSIDKVLNNVMVYWHSNSITSSVRLYKEAISGVANPPLWVKLLMKVDSSVAVTKKWYCMVRLAYYHINGSLRHTFH